MNSRCTCVKTGSARQQEAERTGIAYKKQRSIRRGSPDSPEGETVVSVSGLIVMATMAALFVASVVTAVRATGAVSYIAIVVAVLTGIFLTWTAFLLVFVQIIVTVIRKFKRKGKKKAKPTVH